jgi:RiboL-PSP-HEPN
MHVKVHSEMQKVQDAFDRCDQLPFDDVLRSHWAKYLSIITSGYLEVVIRTVLAEYAKRCANEHVAAYAEAQLGNFQNPSVDKILVVLAQFDPAWVNQLEDFWKEERKAAVASVVNVRHHAAHGRHFGTTIAQMREYHRRINEVVRFLDELILGA